MFNLNKLGWYKRDDKSDILFLRVSTLLRMINNSYPEINMIFKNKKGVYFSAYNNIYHIIDDFKYNDIEYDLERIKIIDNAYNNEDLINMGIASDEVIRDYKIKMLTNKNNNEFNFEKSLSDLFESFDTPSEIKWFDNKNKLIGLFIVNDKVYQITCEEKNKDIWTYKFYLYDKDKNQLDVELTNFNSGYMSVLSTVKLGMEYLIDNKNIKSIVFGATDKSKGRKSLYQKFSEELSTKYNFNLSTNEIDNKKIFILYKDIDKEILFKTVENIIEDLFNEI